MKTEMLTSLSENQTIGNMVAERPSRAEVFERWGLDYCCGGKEPLGAACQAKGLDATALLRELAANDARTPDAPEIDWNAAPLDELAEHIVVIHHAYLRTALPRMTTLIEKVARAHGERHPDLDDLAAAFSTLRRQLESHTNEEESVLFPLIKSLHSPTGTSRPYEMPIHSLVEQMEKEHGQAGNELQKIRSLTNDYLLPTDGCNTYRAMLTGLAEFEADMHRHVHKENSILFPRAAELESSLRAIG